MLHVVTGGSGSGKSEYAEQLILESGKKWRFYIATMRIWDEEGRKRVERHRKMRASKRFHTIECPVDLASLELSAEKNKKEDPTEKAVLLECMSNLVLNEMYRSGSRAEQEIFRGIRRMEEQCGTLVIVTNEVFSDGTFYEEETERYLRLLGSVNRRLGSCADTVTEVVYGIPVKIKEMEREI